MPQSLSRVLIHLIFSTKNREPLIKAEKIADLHKYIIGILKNLSCPSIQTGGVEDHVHILLCLSRTTTQAQVVEEVKKGSSKWMKEEGGCATFSWQAGYGAFSVSESNLEPVKKYIEKQREHHRKVTFQEEYRNFLDKHQVNYDERYVWD